MPSSLPSALIGMGLGAYGEKTKIPDLVSLNPGQIQQQTVKDNIASFGDIAKLATQVNTLNQDQLDAIMEKRLPGGSAMIQKSISSMLRGEVPEDVSRAITRYNAGRNVGALTQGSGFSAGVAAKDLGLTSLDQITKGITSAESWLSRAIAPRMDVSSMFFTPQQRTEIAFQDRQAVFNRNLLSNQMDAAPDPNMVAIAQGFDAEFNNLYSMMGTAGGAVAGAAASGGGGGGL